ncbi:ComF family protein [Ramlibacter tataouinensis]|uniref:ComF family protein n=1 Tax=Ramlibacter tataouinensis TaxID=94132 RepID=UPI0022F3F875|nr:ComF family protein [Ramlibacter tataouinensis]WBY00467.1 ComF family protein [Ramlibacter tataouinensis]
MFRQLVQGLSAAAPAQCEACRAWPAQPLCGPCLERFAEPRPRCRLCALALPVGVERCGRCAGQPPVLDACHAAVSYGYPWAGLIGQFKFAGQPGWADCFARLLLSRGAVRDCLDSADRVVPMPLARERLAARGFNQAHELARRLAPGRADATLALRLRDTPAQARLDREARLANLRHAFALEPARAHEARGRRIVLVDDVMTSGASLFALAGVFRAAGASQVSAVVLARTEEV